MATPKTLPQKIAQFQNDSFDVWMQKTNISTNESGDLNKLSVGVLSELQAQTSKTGTVAATSGSQTLSGTSTTFLTSVSVGDVIKITVTSPPSVIEKRVLSITNDTTLIVDSAFSAAFSGATYENLQSLSLVSAINYMYESESRRILVRAIAMS